MALRLALGLGIGLGSGFNYFRHCAICIVPNTESRDRVTVDINEQQARGSSGRAVVCVCPLEARGLERTKFFF